MCPNPRHHHQQNHRHHLQHPGQPLQHGVEHGLRDREAEQPAGQHPGQGGSHHHHHQQHQQYHHYLFCHVIFQLSL